MNRKQSKLGLIYTINELESVCYMTDEQRAAYELLKKENVKICFRACCVLSRNAENY